MILRYTCTLKKDQESGNIMLMPLHYIYTIIMPTRFKILHQKLMIFCPSCFLFCVAHNIELKQHFNLQDLTVFTWQIQLCKFITVVVYVECSIASTSTLIERTRGGRKGAESDEE